MPIPTAAIAIPEPPAPHTRQTVHDGTQWRWADDRRHRREPAPDVPCVLRDKIGEHGVPPVQGIIGLSRVAILGVAAGVASNLGSWTCCAVRLSELARLDVAADDQ